MMAKSKRRAKKEAVKRKKVAKLKHLKRSKKKVKITGAIGKWLSMKQISKKK